MTQDAPRIAVPDAFPQSGDVRGRRVVITGGAKGLGRVLASAFHRGGAAVALVGRSVDDLAVAAAELGDERVLTFAGDVSDPDVNESVAEQVAAAWGGLDVWISNAGIAPVVANAASLAPEDWQRVLDVNLSGAFYGGQAAARHMGAGGRIIFTGSVIGARPKRGFAAYAASKAALVATAKTMALDLAPRNILVNVVSPGWFDSPLAEPWKERPELGEAILSHTALKRWGAGEELAGAYLFLASNASSFVTGTVITVDGGYLLG